MAHTDVSKTYVGTPGSYTAAMKGGIWRIPLTLVLPTDVYSAMPVGAIPLGGVSDEGYLYTSERATDKKRDFNGDKVRSVQQSKDDTLEITFIEFLNPVVMTEVFGSNNVTVIPSSAAHGTQIVTKSVADVLDHGAYIINTKDKGVKRRRVIPDAQPDKIDPIVEKPGDWSVYKVTYDLFPDSQGVTSYTYTELGDVWVPSAWTVTIAGSSGTVVYTVTKDGVSASTSALAYNVATSALDTALEALSTVGVGNATVTGTAGTSYSVTLANGGVLSAVGSAGATATVVPA